MLFVQQIIKTPPVISLVPQANISVKENFKITWKDSFENIHT